MSLGRRMFCLSNASFGICFKRACYACSSTHFLFTNMTNTTFLLIYIDYEIRPTSCLSCYFYSDFSIKIYSNKIT